MNGNGNTILSENICNFQCRQAVPTPSQQSRGSAALFSHWITTDQHSISKKCNTRAPLYCTQASAKEAGNKPILSAALPSRCLPTWVASHLKYIFFIGMGFTFSLHNLFLFENGKPVAATSEWDLHSQKEYPFWECRMAGKFGLFGLDDSAHSSTTQFHVTCSKNFF